MRTHPSPACTRMPRLSARSTSPGCPVPASAGAGCAANRLMSPPRSAVKARGSGHMARTRRQTSWAGLEKSTRQSSFLIFLQKVTPSSPCGVSTAVPLSTFLSASTIASAPRAESSARSSPAVFSPTGTRRESSMSPLSSPSSVRMTVTPVYSSPASTACCTGDAPRQRGNRDAWMLYTPRGKASSTSCVRICP